MKPEEVGLSDLEAQHLMQGGMIQIAIRASGNSLIIQGLEHRSEVLVDEREEYQRNEAERVERAAEKSSNRWWDVGKILFGAIVGFIIAKSS